HKRRGAENVYRAQRPFEGILYRCLRILLLLEIADDLQVHAGQVESRHREQREDHQHDEGDQQRGAALAADSVRDHGISLLPAAFTICTAEVYTWRLNLALVPVAWGTVKLSDASAPIL